MAVVLSGALRVQLPPNFTDRKAPDTSRFKTDDENDTQSRNHACIQATQKHAPCRPLTILSFFIVFHLFPF